MQGCSPELRVEVWPYLLRLDSPSADSEQRRQLRVELSRSYAKLLQRCQVSRGYSLPAPQSHIQASYGLPAVCTSISNLDI